jgi:hypothetical protein
MIQNRIAIVGEESPVRRDARVFCIWPRRISVCAAAVLAFSAGLTSAQTNGSETQLRASVGSASEGGLAWGLRLSRVSSWNGVVIDVSGAKETAPINLKASWNLLSEDSSAPDVVRLGVGFSHAKNNQRRVALSFSQETDGLGWTAGATHGLGKSSVFARVPTFTDNSVVPPRVVQGYDVLTRPWRYGAFGRGIYADETLGIRVTLGADVEWETSSSRQITSVLLAEKYFAKTPLSVAFTWEHGWLPKDSPGGRASDRFGFSLRYELTRNSGSGFESLRRRSEDTSESATLRETFYLKSMDNGYTRVAK